ncbi:hypothetical protein H5410_045240 [Solanum commersonii]|uniref:Uncharacterized protein n=1 Tax=Solanum commersonii TaxID=4109 RepID=A0A9J5XC41_SOLCO|nr:hypothetical protein H5410_045240 [Solanum commersonii]
MTIKILPYPIKTAVIHPTRRNGYGSNKTGKQNPSKIQFFHSFFPQKGEVCFYVYLGGYS